MIGSIRATNLLTGGFVLLLFSLLLFLGCSQTAGESLRSLEKVRNRDSLTLLDQLPEMPARPASRDGGTEAARFLLRFWTSSDDVKELSKLQKDDRKRTSIHRLLTFFKGGNPADHLNARLLGRDLDLVKRAVEHGMVPLIRVKTRKLPFQDRRPEAQRYQGSFHYFPVVGYGSGSLVVADPEGNRVLSETDVLRAWTPSVGHWLLIWDETHQPNPDGTEEIRTLFENGVRLYEEEKFNRAWKVFQQITERNPFFAGAYANMGMIRFKEKEYREAERLFREALKRDPSLYYIQNNLSYTLFLQRRNISEAERRVRTVIRDNLPRLSTLSKSEVQKMDNPIIGRTQSDLRRLVSEAYHIRGRIHRHRARPARARADFHQALLIDKSERAEFRSMLYRLLGETQRTLGRYEEAIFSIQKAISISPSSSMKDNLKELLKKVRREQKQRNDTER